MNSDFSIFGFVLLVHSVELEVTKSLYDYYLFFEWFFNFTLFQPKSKTKELYNQACAHLASQGMLETDLFGLSVILGK